VQDRASCTAGERAQARGLEVKLQSQLPDPGLSRPGHLSKTTRGQVARRVAELRVVEDVEELRPELCRHSLRDPRGLVEGEIPVVQTGTVEIVAAALGDDIDDGARKAPIFGVKRISDQPEFLDGVERGDDGGPVVPAFFDVAAIDQESIGCRSSGRRKEPTL